MIGKNINNWNGEWVCPQCKGKVKPHICGCGLSYFVYKEPGESNSEVVFYFAGKLTYVKIGGGLLMSNSPEDIYAVFLVDKEGNIISEISTSRRYLMSNVDRLRTRAPIPVPDPRR